MSFGFGIKKDGKEIKKPEVKTGKFGFGIKKETPPAPPDNPQAKNLAKQMATGLKINTTPVGSTTVIKKIPAFGKITPVGTFGSGNNGLNPEQQDVATQVIKRAATLQKQDEFEKLARIEEKVGKVITGGVVIGMLSNPVSVTLGLAGFETLAEIENALVSKLKKDPYQFRAGRELSEFAMADTASEKALLDIAEFAGKALVLGGVAKTPKVADVYIKSLSEKYNLPIKTQALIYEKAGLNSPKKLTPPKTVLGETKPTEPVLTPQIKPQEAITEALLPKTAKTAPKAKTVATDPLIQEAKKYKSAEELFNDPESVFLFEQRKPQANPFQDTLPSKTRPSSIKEITKSGGNPLYHDTDAKGVLGILDSGEIKTSQAPFSQIVGQGKRVSTTRNFDNYSRYHDSPYRLIIDESKTGQKAIPDNREEFESIFKNNVKIKSIDSIAIDSTNPVVLDDIKSGKLLDVIKKAEEKGIKVELFEGKILPDEYSNKEIQTLTKSQLTDIWNKAQEVKAPKVKTEVPKIEPVKVERTIGTPSISKRIETQTVEKGLTEAFKDMPDYEKVSRGDQAIKVQEILDTDPDKAIRIALGKELPTNGALPESVLIAVKNNALETGNTDLLVRLATEEGGVARESSILGQRIKMLDETNPDDAFTNIKRVVNERRSALEQKTGKKMGQILKEETTKIKNELDKVKPKKDVWLAFVSEIQC
ncbi:MAG: hypothetical protein PHX62_03125 [Bacilli bacterium]|nr:hypothetical protein [Bacilli bacterium]